MCPFVFWSLTLVWVEVPLPQVRWRVAWSPVVAGWADRSDGHCAAPIWTRHPFTLTQNSQSFKKLFRKREKIGSHLFRQFAEFNMITLSFDYLSLPLVANWLSASRRARRRRGRTREGFLSHILNIRDGIRQPPINKQIRLNEDIQSKEQASKPLISLDHKQTHFPMRAIAPSWTFGLSSWSAMKSYNTQQ